MKASVLDQAVTGSNPTLATNYYYERHIDAIKRKNAREMVKHHPNKAKKKKGVTQPLKIFV